MKLITSELEIKNKKFVIKYGLILLGVSLLIYIMVITLGGLRDLNIPDFFKGMMALPLPVFLISWILMIMSYQIQIISYSDFSRRIKNKDEPKAEKDDLTIRNQDAVVFIWFAMQILLGFFGHIFYFGFGSVNKIDNFDILAIILISILPTILFIISSYFARLNRIENKIDLLLKEKEENN
jgi:hypothetical protein